MSESPSEQPIRPFEFYIDDHQYILRLGNCAVHLFRQEQEKDFIWVEGSPSAKIFGNVELARFLAGYAIIHTEEGDIDRPTTVYQPENGEEWFTFRSEYGWNPLHVEHEIPSDEIRAAYLEAMTDKRDWK